MPELPEVETVRRQLEPVVRGRRLERIEVLDARWCRPLDPLALADALVGRTVVALRRRGKYLEWELDGDLHLLMHLRMTGTLLLDPAATPAHTRVRLQIDARTLLFVDPRRFGTGELLAGSDALERFYALRLGVEPFSEQFTPQLLRESARGRRGPIKSFLLDQRHIAGIGNIYADEALYRSEIHPLRPAGSLTLREHARLHEAIRTSLLAGIDARGASFDDFRDLDGARGSYQDRFLVHRRAGEPCARCGAIVGKLIVGGRGTYVCARCQRAPRGARSPRPSSADRGRASKQPREPPG